MTEKPNIIYPNSAMSAQDQESDRALAAYDYDLPEELIAQNPVSPRDSSRLLVVDSPHHHQHRIFRDLPELLKPGDLLVLNNTRVIPARLYGRKSSGASAEVLLLEEQQHNCWLALVKPGKRLQPGAKIVFESQQSGGAGERESGRITHHQLPITHHPSLLSATVVATDAATGGRILQFDLPAGVSLLQLLDQFGHVPLPPYITDSQAQPEQYQTVYAQQPGAVAAPTAGLHFTPELLERLQGRNIEQAFVTLHVGVGTFRPVEVEEITTHKMHEEWVELPKETVAKIQETKARRGRIIAVGTTAVRALEGAAAAESLGIEGTREQESGRAGENFSSIPTPFRGKTDLFIYPGYQWRVVEGLITNFHLPRSSLLMLVSALVGRQRLLDLYREAIAHRYRFYSFGDAMLILPSVGNR